MLEDLYPNLFGKKHTESNTKRYPLRKQKINYIENELFRRAMEENVTTKELIKIHDELCCAENDETSTAIKDENSLNAWFNRMVFMAASILALATASSYLGVKVCGNNRSYFCKSMHDIPNFIDAVFQEPKSKILPVDINK